MRIKPRQQKVTERDPASFRDSAGYVYVAEDRVYRTVTAAKLNEFNQVRATPLIPELIQTQQLIAEEVIEVDTLGDWSKGSELVLAHPKLSFISYPYEWPAELLRTAALLHLEIQLKALSHNVSLVDASAYNIQFQGVNPIFIDSLSFRPYQEGEYWLAHKQFCEQFLNPLLLSLKVGVSYHDWYRGTLEGIPTTDLNHCLSFWQKCSWHVFTQVVLQARFQGKTKQQAAQVAVSKRFPRIAYQQMLQSLHSWIKKLKNTQAETTWQDYTATHSYDQQEVAQKEKFVQEFISQEGIKQLWDFGCNTGMYSEVALQAGADSVIGFDADHGALQGAVQRARDNQLNFLPLYLDLTNPSPSQGWGSIERKNITERGNPDGIIALALLHHLAIAKNIPIPMVLDWLLAIAPKGVIEFVPKNDPMVQLLLSLREDIFTDYSEESFLMHLQQRARILNQIHVTQSGRLLVSYEVCKK
jgi:ribosomal protein L11 methylase PrmA